MEFAPDKHLDKMPDSNPVVQLTEDNWRRELLQSTRPVIVLTESKNCAGCSEWQADFATKAKEHPEFKFAVSDAAQFGFPETKAPIISTIGPGIGTAFLQHVDFGDARNNQEFWQKRFDVSNKELQDSTNVTELQKTSRDLLIAVTKYSLEKGAHSPEETKLFEENEKKLGSASEALAKTKLEIISELQGQIDESIINPGKH
jgi:hypothetical protein